MTEREEKLTKVLGGLCLLFDREFQPALAGLWDKALSDLSVEDIDRAVSKWVAVSGKRFPVPAEIRELIQGSASERAETALQICINNSIFDLSVEFADPAITVAIERSAGSWENWCEWVRFMPEHEFQWKRKDWIKHYIQNFQQPGVRKCFMGYKEQLNRLSGGFQPVIRRVGLDGKFVEEKLLPSAPPVVKEISAGSEVIPMHEFFSESSISELALSQKVEPLKDPSVLLGGIPESENVDEFVGDIYDSRK